MNNPPPNIIVAPCLEARQIVVSQNSDLINACIDGKIRFESKRPGKALGATIRIDVHNRVREDVVIQDVTDVTGGSLNLSVIIRREITSLRIVLQKNWAYAHGLEIEIGNESHHQASGVIVRNADSHAALMFGDELVVIIGVTADQFSQPI